MFPGFISCANGVLGSFNRRVIDDPRVDSVQLTVGDGLTLLFKR